MIIRRLIFWSVVLTASSLIFYGLTAHASTKQAAYTQTWCDKLNGVRVVDNGLVIPCLTKTYAIFNEPDSLVKYMIEYGDKYGQLPALIIKEK